MVNMDVKLTMEHRKYVWNLLKLTIKAVNVNDAILVSLLLTLNIDIISNIVLVFPLLTFEKLNAIWVNSFV